MAIEAIGSSASVYEVRNQVTPAEPVAVSADLPEKDNSTMQVTAKSQSSIKKSDVDSEQEKKDVYELERADSEQVKKAIEEINQKIRPTRTSCRFAYHDETNRISIKVIDDETDKVIREIPPEKALDIIAKTLELEGLLLDERR